jgi:phenylacetate-CoA ligase
MEKEDTRFWMKDIETAGRGEIKELQLSKLKKMLEYVEARSRFYQEKFTRDKVSVSKIKTLDNLSALPFTTRDEIVDDQEKYGRLGRLMATDFSTPGQTLGLTGVKISASGQPIRVIISLADAAFQGKLGARGLTCAGVSDTDYLYIADFPQFNLLYMHIGLGSVTLGSKSIMVGMERAERNNTIFPSLYPPSVYYINPTYSKFVLKILQKSGKKYGIRAVLGWGEPGYSIASLRERFQEKWAEVSSAPEVKVCDVYSMVEMGLLAFECRQQNGLHGFEDAYIYEIIDPETEEPLPAGEEGELVITHLQREGMPLIRYRTGDITTVDDSPCPCGRTHLRLKGIKGRYSQRLKIAEKTIYASQVEDIVARFKQYLGEFNILTDGAQALDRLDLAFAQEDMPSNLAMAIQKELGERLGVPIQITPVNKQDLIIFTHRSCKIIDRQKLEFYKKEVADQIKTET